MVTRERLGDIEPEHTDGSDDPSTDGLGDGAHTDQRRVTASPGDSLVRRKRMVPDRSHRSTVWSEPDNGMTDHGLQIRSS